MIDKKSSIAISWIVGFLAFVTSQAVLAGLFDLSPECWSGWQSPSIGKQGACSHHGGVNRTAENISRLLSLSIGVFVGIWLYARPQPRPKALSVRQSGEEMSKDQQDRHDLDAAISGMGSALRSLISELSVFARYCWNFEMKFLQTVGLMPLFRSHWWLFLVVAFALLAFVAPIGLAFIFTAVSALNHEPKSSNNFMVPLRKREVFDEEGAHSG